MTTPLIHGDLLASLRNFYPSTVTIQQPANTQGTDGALTSTWTNVTNRVNLPCRIAPASLAAPAAQEVRTPAMTVTTNRLWIALRGSYPDIAVGWRAVSGGVNYTIMAVDNDGAGATTRLGVEVVSL